MADKSKIERADATKELIQMLVDALRHARPHVYASSIKGMKLVIEEIDLALIVADEVIQWSDNT